MEVKEVRVGIADLNIVSYPGRLITIGLGSCVGIVVYDKVKSIAGLAHIMLPDSKNFTNVSNPYKFADMAVPILIEKLEKNGALKRNMVAKIAGGASMFSFSDKSMIMDIGARNYEAVKAALSRVSVPIISEDIGGNKGRTIIFDTTNGMVQVRTVGLGIKEI